MESYVLPERPSGLKKAMALAGVPRSLQALTHLAGARHRGLGLPSRSSHRESTHTFLRATPPPNSLARYSAGDWTAFIILHITSPSRPSITISAQGRRLGSYHVPGVQTEGTSALRHKLAKQETNSTLLQTSHYYTKFQESSSAFVCIEDSEHIKKSPAFSQPCNLGRSIIVRAAVSALLCTPKRQEFIQTSTPPPHMHSHLCMWQNHHLGWFKRLLRFSDSFSSLSCCQTKSVSKAMYSQNRHTSCSYLSLQNVTSGTSTTEWLEKPGIIVRQSFLMQE